MLGNVKPLNHTLYSEVEEILFDAESPLFLAYGNMLCKCKHIGIKAMPPRVCRQLIYIGKTHYNTGNYSWTDSKRLRLKGHLDQKHKYVLSCLLNLQGTVIPL